MTYVGALPPAGFVLSEWQVVSESAVPSPFGERRIVVACRLCAVMENAALNGDLLEPGRQPRNYSFIHIKDRAGDTAPTAIVNCCDSNYGRRLRCHVHLLRPSATWLPSHRVAM